MQGRPWERQALIKVRPVAGDLALGKRLIELTRPFVFPKYFDDSTLEDIRETKRAAEAQTADKGQTDNEVKLGRGGIRDIEFTVQMLQLLNGGRKPGLRLTNTLDTIEALGNERLLSAFEALALSRNYVFLRQVEHRLQIEGSQQRHALPTDPHDLDDFGRRLGYQSGDAFMVGYRDRSDETRQILDQFFDAQGSGDLWLTELLNPSAEAEHGLDRLRELGFANPGSARGELARQANGDAARPHSAHVRQTFREVALLKSASDPDAALYRLRNAQILRVGMRELLQDIDSVTIGRELTLVADLCVREVLEVARAKPRLTSPCSAPPRRSGRFPALPYPPGGQRSVYHSKYWPQGHTTNKQEILSLPMAQRIGA
ncbi:MAG: hypothetical protein QGG73_04580 [Candidatus Hydrogenedentes bacterium]|nr:hypothetical protein [Candidatus Hydrogenedentota bacterium]